MNQEKTTVTEKIPFTDDWMFGMTTAEIAGMTGLSEKAIEEL